MLLVEEKQFPLSSKLILIPLNFICGQFSPSTFLNDNEMQRNLIFTSDFCLNMSKNGPDTYFIQILDLLIYKCVKNQFKSFLLKNKILNSQQVYQHISVI